MDGYGGRMLLLRGWSWWRDDAGHLPVMRDAARGAVWTGDTGRLLGTLSFGDEQVVGWRQNNGRFPKTCR